MTMIIDIDRQETVEATKICVKCQEFKPLKDFLGRSGKRAGRTRRRGTCRACRQVAAEPEASAFLAEIEPAQEEPGKKRKKRRRRKSKKGAAPANTPAIETTPDESAPEPIGKPKHNAAVKVAPVNVSAVQSQVADESGLKPTRQGFIRMRGKTDNGRRWYQEVDPELAYILVRENAAVVVNRHTIRRLYGNKEFRRMILVRDNHTCYFCGRIRGYDRPSAASVEGRPYDADQLRLRLQRMQPVQSEYRSRGVSSRLRLIAPTFPSTIAAIVTAILPYYPGSGHIAATIAVILSKIH